jgi:formylglycine-generating enzyme required for sulfatase activity
MVWIPAGNFRMGSDIQYPEEAPAHRISVDGFRIERTPVTNRKFKQFAKATGHVAKAEITPDPRDYPGAYPMPKGGSHLCAPNYRHYRPAARHAEPIDTSASHVGFRCVIREGAPR